LDFSKLQEYFEHDSDIVDMVDDLEELRVEYLEAELYIAQSEAGTPTIKRRAHDRVHWHSGMLSELIRLLKSMHKPDNH
jgi:hypothetical protein